MLNGKRYAALIIAQFVLQKGETVLLARLPEHAFDCLAAAGNGILAAAAHEKLRRSNSEGGPRHAIRYVPTAPAGPR